MKTHIDIKHLLIRLIIMISIPAATLILLFANTSPQYTESGHSAGMYGFGQVVFTIMTTFILLCLLIGETIYLYCAKKTAKSNANLILIAGFGCLLWLINSSLF